MISLKRIVEQQGANGQFYDLGQDFANFRRAIDGTFEQIKQKFEQNIGAKLNGKRIRARASRGYKQYVKEYEFDVSKITLDDYYDNYVVIAHDNTTPKPKEYFLKPGFKITIVGPATGAKPQDTEQPATPPAALPNAQHQPMKPVAPQAPQASPGQTMTETEVEPATAHGTGHYDGYSIDTISDDIKPWLPRILKKPDTALRDFIVGLGWLKNLEHGKTVAMFDLKLPLEAVKVPLTTDNLQKLVQMGNKNGVITTQYDVVSAKPDEHKQDILVRVKKTMQDKSAV